MCGSEGSHAGGSHLIQRDDVPAWLAGSAVTQITVHQTSTESARHNREAGVQIERTARDSAWGRGFYPTTRPDPRYGEVGVRVAVRLLRPFVVKDPIDGQERVDAMLLDARTDDVRAVLMAAGFESVIMHRSWRDEVWVVTYTGDQVKVVTER